MFITNLDEVVDILRIRLRDYLVIKLGIRANARKFKCFVHNDNDPSMHFNPKNNDQTVKCFSCNWSGDIFACAAQIENLPNSGPEWATTTIPALAETLGIPLKLGEPSQNDKEKARLYKLNQDILQICQNSNPPNHILEYISNRNWRQESLECFSVEEEALISSLVEIGWDSAEINRSMIVRKMSRHRNVSFFGNDKITFPVKDQRGRTLGFVSRNIATNANSKYINTPENLVYEKGKTLLGIDIAVTSAKKKGIYIVEGPGDLANMYRLGIYNAAAVCGTAFTEHHLLLLKSLGIRKIFLNFDWDNAGCLATQRVLEEILAKPKGVSVFVVSSPSESFDGYAENPKDPDEFLFKLKGPDAYLKLLKKTAFQWQLDQSSDNDSPDLICSKMIPTIASEEAAVKRELLIETLSEYTGISHQSIASDVFSLRNDKYNERKERLITSAQQYLQCVSEDPHNIVAHFTNHEQTIDKIEKKYQKNSVGVNYQLARYEAIQDLRSSGEDKDPNHSKFIMDYFPGFSEAMSGGMNWARGCLIYVGGRANSGKTATVLSIGCDVALSDPNAIVIIHSTDDSYEQIEPRLKTNLYRMANPEKDPLSIGMVVQPHLYLDKQYEQAYLDADQIFKDLISEERLIIIDSEDGPSLSILERNLRYYRQRHPSKKMMLIVDNTHNYMDFTNLDQTSRMTMISNQQKHLCTKYHSCMIATAEYRKNMPLDPAKFKLPVDDDLADARALMYRPNAIFHVYNDLHDRKEHAEIFWQDQDGIANPRLLLHFTKNKISGFKDKLVLDLDPSSVTLIPKASQAARNETAQFVAEKEAGSIKIDGSSVIRLKTEYAETSEEFA